MVAVADTAFMKASVLLGALAEGFALIPKTGGYRVLADAVKGWPSLAGKPMTCPHCGTLCSPVDESWTNFINLGNGPRIDGDIVLTVGGGRCPACSGLLTIATVLKPRDDSRALLLLWPRDVRPDRSPQDLDAGIKKAYDESRQVLSLSPQAAAALSRRCLQHAIREKLGIKKKTLFEEIAEAILRDELSRNTRESLDHIRQIGNWAAHPSLDQAETIIDVTTEEASYTIDVVELLFHDLYVQPAKIQMMKASIANR
jgi:hypothetical protein